MLAWAGNQTHTGGFYRVRYTGKQADLRAKAGAVELTITDPRNYEVWVWGLKRSQNYGSKHVDERILAVAVATVRFDLPDLAPTWGISIRYRVKGTDGRAVTGLIHNTIHNLGK